MHIIVRFKKLCIFAAGISNRPDSSVGRCKGIRCKTGAVPAAVTSVSMMSATAEATVAAAQWEGHADRRKPEYLLMSTIRSTELPGLGAKLILSWNKQPLGVSPLWECFQLIFSRSDVPFCFFNSDA